MDGGKLPEGVLGHKNSTSSKCPLAHMRLSHEAAISGAPVAWWISCYVGLVFPDCFWIIIRLWLPRKIVRKIENADAITHVGVQVLPTQGDLREAMSRCCE